jgi:hypothetical protein
MSPTEERRATWQRLLAEQQASGHSVTSWCFAQDISLQTFYYWRKRLAADTPSASTPQWLAVAPAVGPVSTAASLTLRVGPVAIEVPAGFDPHLLADVLTVLEQR